LIPLFSALLLCLGASLATEAAAGDNCRLRLDPVPVDYGRLTRQAILGQPPNAYGHSLGKRLVMLSVTCDAPARLALFARGSAADDGGFRFGPQGRLTLTASQAMLDGKAIALGVVDQAGNPPVSIAPSAPLLPGKGLIALVDGQAGSGSRLSLQIELEATVPAGATVVTSETDWAGSAGIELIAR